MPIYDFDGAVHTEVGKLFDFDGTAKHQIGRVYDHDGTAAALLYSGETAFFNSGAAVPFSTYEYQADVNIGSTIQINHGAQDVGWGAAWTTDKQDLSGASKVTFTFDSVNNKGNCVLRVGVGLDTGSSLNPFAGTGFVKYVDISTAGTYSVDVSDLTGDYYISMAQNSSTAAYSNSTCTKIIAE